MSRSMFGMAWFQTCWAFEESRHGLVFREYLTRSGLRSPAQFETLETATFSNEWKLPFQTIRQMACYGALQESATFTAYNLQRNKAREAGDVVLEAIFLFKMPGDGLIPDYRLRLESSGAGISLRDFLARVVWPLLTTLKISREEIGRALTRRVAANPD